MDGDLGAMLASVMSDPEQMAKITAAAQSLMGGAAAETPPAPPPAVPRPAEAGDSGLLAAVGKALGGFRAGNTRSAALLSAMRPYMRPEKQEKLDRALQITRMVHVAGAVMGQWKGGQDGV